MGRDRVNKRKKLNRRQRRRRQEENVSTLLDVIAFVVKIHEAAGSADRLRKLTANVDFPIMRLVPTELGGDAPDAEPYLQTWNRIRTALMELPEAQAEIDMYRSLMDGHERGDGAAMDRALGWMLSGDAHGLQSVG